MTLSTLIAINAAVSATAAIATTGTATSNSSSCSSRGDSSILGTKGVCIAINYGVCPDQFVTEEQL